MYLLDQFIFEVLLFATPRIGIYPVAARIDFVLKIMVRPPPPTHTHTHTHTNTHTPHGAYAAWRERRGGCTCVFRPISITHPPTCSLVHTHYQVIGRHAEHHWNGRPCPSSIECRWADRVTVPAGPVGGLHGSKGPDLPWYYGVVATHADHEFSNEELKTELDKCARAIGYINGRSSSSSSSSGTCK
jgi:hypothetical protein